MSKNTGTSELINYFDLGVNGDVGIAGSLTIDTIASATTEADKLKYNKPVEPLIIL